MSGLIISIDVGFKNMGLVVGRETPSGVHLSPTVISVEDSPLYKKKQGVLVADRDLRGCGYLFDRLYTCFSKVHVDGVVAELPSAGAQGARANRCMGMASAIFASVTEVFDLLFEGYLPDDCTKAVLGTSRIPKVQKGVHARGKDKGKPRMVSPKKAMVAKAVHGHFGWDQDLLDAIAPSKREHVFDAAAALVAAKDGQVVRVAKWDRSKLEMVK